MKVTVYGPHATPERLAQAAAVMESCGAAALLLASILPEGGCVVFGRKEHVDVLAPWPAGDAMPFANRPHRIAPLPRAELAATLRGLLREEDARKIESGPPDEKPPRGARLLVVALADCVAVTWSHPPLRTTARGGRA